MLSIIIIIMISTIIMIIVLIVVITKIIGTILKILILINYHRKKEIHYKKQNDKRTYIPILLVIIIKSAIARSSSFTPSLGFSFITNLPKEEATIEPLKFIPSSEREKEIEREGVKGERYGEGEG